MIQTAIALPITIIRDYCQMRPITRLSVFGSVLRDDFSSESDVDLLVTFTPEARVSYFDLHTMQEDLANIIGRRVDLRTPQEISPYFVDDVLARAQVIYERS